MSVSRLYIAGVTPKSAALSAVARDARAPRYKRGWQMNASHRRKELSAVVNYRRANGLAIGPDAGWAMVLGNLLRVLHGHVTAEMLQAEAAAIGRPPLNDPAVDVALQEIMGKAWGKYRLYTAAQAGSLIEITTVERTDAGISKMEAVEEPGEIRRRRERRQYMRSWRAARAAPKVSKKEIAACLGISLSTLHRMLRRGDLRIADTISVTPSPLPSVDPVTQNVSRGKRR